MNNGLYLRCIDAARPTEGGLPVLVGAARHTQFSCPHCSVVQYSCLSLGIYSGQIPMVQDIDIIL